jgi:hypothetical protein
VCLRTSAYDFGRPYASTSSVPSTNNTRSYSRSYFKIRTHRCSVCVSIENFPAPSSPFATRTAHAGTRGQQRLQDLDRCIHVLPHINITVHLALAGMHRLNCCAHTLHCRHLQRDPGLHNSKLTLANILGVESRLIASSQDHLDFGHTSLHLYLSTLPMYLGSIHLLN